jgi:release factor glutamine methyltransferase
MQRDSVGAALICIKNQLGKAGIASARLDARLIVQHATRLSHEQLIADTQRAITERESRSIEKMALRRAAHEPVSRLLGEREFYGRIFRIDQHTFDPRPDTETLVETVLKIVRLRSSSGQGWRIGELGTGSGAIIVTLLAELPEAIGVAGDMSSEALAIARENALRHKVANRVDLVNGSWFEGFTGSFDMIVSNPPYIAEEDMAALAPEVRLYDPVKALDGGPDGLKAYRQIAKDARRYLRINGYCCLEIGSGQEEKVTNIMLDGRLRLPCKVPRLSQDFSGITRVLTFEND